MLCVQLVGDSTVLKEKVAHCQLTRLELHVGSHQLLPALKSVKDNWGEPISTCLRVVEEACPAGLHL